MCCALQALYSWWQYELCDVFIELVKPVMARSSSEQGADADKRAFRDTLWTCLDTGLRCRSLCQTHERLVCVSWSVRLYRSQTCA